MAERGADDVWDDFEDPVEESSVATKKTSDKGADDGLGDAPQSERTPEEIRRRQLIRWWGPSAGAFMLAVALGITTGVIASGQEADLADEYEAAYAADSRITVAEDQLAALPGGIRIERQFIEMTEAADQVSVLQGDLHRRGERRITDSNGEELPEEEQQTQEEADEELWAIARSGLSALFVRVREDSEDSEVTLRSERLIGSWCSEEGTEPLGEWSWVGGDQIDERAPTSIPVIWELRAEDGHLVCQVESTWLTDERAFERPQITVYGEDLLAEDTTNEDEEGES